TSEMSWMPIHSVPSGFSTIGIPAEVNRKPPSPPWVLPADVSGMPAQAFAWRWAAAEAGSGRQSVGSGPLLGSLSPGAKYADMLLPREGAEPQISGTRPFGSLSGSDRRAARPSRGPRRLL